MNMQAIASRIDVETARTFVRAARRVVDAMLLEAQEVRATETPGRRDYAQAALDRSTPAGGWLSQDTLRRTTQELAEAIAAERWTDGVVCALRVFGALGGA